MGTRETHLQVLEHAEEVVQRWEAVVGLLKCGLRQGGFVSVRASAAAAIGRPIPAPRRAPLKRSSARAPRTLWAGRLIWLI